MSLRRVPWGTKSRMFSIPFVLAAASTGWSSGPAEVSDWLGLSGTARISFFTKDTSFVDAPGVQNDSIWLTAKPHDIAGVSSYFDARLQGQLVKGNSKISGDLREGYLEENLGEFEGKAGRQIIVWGRADKINPTDVWSTRDYKLLATDDDDQRVGLATTQVTWSRNSEHIILIWQPEWRTPGLPIPPLPPGFSFTNRVASSKAEQFGLKYDHSGSGIDWSLSYAHAINRTPDLAVLAIQPPQTKLGLAYNYAETVGADAATPMGNYGLRGEVAYTHARNPGGLNPLAQDNNLFAVLGVERTWAGELNVNLQYLYQKSFDYRGVDSVTNPSLGTLPEQARVINNQLAADMQGASLRIDYKACNETLETELAALMWFKKMDSIVTWKTSYAFTDRLKGIVGANIWSGPADSFFGRLRRTSTAFVEFRIGF